MATTWFVKVIIIAVFLEYRELHCHKHLYFHPLLHVQDRHPCVCQTIIAIRKLVFFNGVGCIPLHLEIVKKKIHFKCKDLYTDLCRFITFFLNIS